MGCISKWSLFGHPTSARHPASNRRLFSTMRAGEALKHVHWVGHYLEIWLSTEHFDFFVGFPKEHLKSVNDMRKNQSTAGFESTWNPAKSRKGQCLPGKQPLIDVHFHQLETPKASHFVAYKHDTFLCFPGRGYKYSINRNCPTFNQLLICSSLSATQMRISCSEQRYRGSFYFQSK